MECQDSLERNEHWSQRPITMTEQQHKEYDRPHQPANAAILAAASCQGRFALLLLPAANSLLRSRPGHRAMCGPRAADWALSTELYACHRTQPTDSQYQRLWSSPAQSDGGPRQPKRPRIPNMSGGMLNFGFLVPETDLIVDKT